MPFASKVGAMPPEQSLAQDDGASSRSSLQKAITIQDLKQQTAMRLAHEHHQGQALPGDPRNTPLTIDNRNRRPVVTPQTLAARRNAHASTGHNSAPSVNREPAPLHYQRLHHHAPVTHRIPNTVEAHGMAPAYGASQYYDHSHKNPRNRNAKSKPGRKPVVSQHSAPPVSIAAGGRYHPEPRSQYLRPAPAPALPNPLSSTSSSGYHNSAPPPNQGGQSSSSSKLPHGLTVHELKEMTKARLQAESAEKMPSVGGSTPSTAVVEMEARDVGVFDGTQSNFGQPVPPQHMQSQRMLPEQSSYFRQPAQVSPTSPAFHSYRPAGSSFDHAAQDPNRVLGNRNRVDSYPESNWENASVTSHNSTVASDYLGSESAFSSGVGGGFSQAGDDQSGLSLGRTQSYPVGNGRSAADMPSRETTPTSVPSPLGSTYFDASASMAQNRQRAMTLSPRPGLSLLHEDRAGFSDEDLLGIPSFSSSSRHTRQQLPTRSWRSFSPIMQPQAFTSENFVGFGNSAAGVIGGGMQENRPRTSSAVSLPAISHTAEEFALDVNGANSRRSADGSFLQAPIQEHGDPSLTGAGEILMGSSSLYGNGDIRTQGPSSSVFRGEYGGIPAPPGLGPNDGMASASHMNPLNIRAGNMDGLGSENNRVRASTWVAGGDVFGSSSGLYESTVDDTLAGDLASILMLSGAEERPDNERSGGVFNDISDSFLGKSNDFGRNIY